MAQQDRLAEDGDPFAGMCVLVVENDEIMRLSLEDRLRLEKIPVKLSDSLAAARDQLKSGNIDMVVSDIRLPDGSGADLFEEIRSHYPGLPVLLMTAFGDITDAVALVKAGAIDYLTKPFNMADFIAIIRRNLSRIADVRLSGEEAGMAASSFRPGSGVLGKSAAMRRIERLIARLSDVDSSVLITGESGVGKEVVASLLHGNSRRARGPFIKVNCAALSASLIESELFGHEKGAFTDAIARRIGRFEQAQKGTIFLDEIAEIALETQVKLLRVLQEREIERVGGDDPVALDVRVLAATQVDLDKAVKSGRFRADLFWRLNVIHIDIPPLRERPEDILYLSRLFVRGHAETMESSVAGLSAEAEAKLLSMSYPGNVRELKNILERAVALCDGPKIMTKDLLPFEESLNGADDRADVKTLRQSVAEAEALAIREALSRSGWAIGEAALSLGISRKSLWEKMKRYQVIRENEQG